MNTGTIFLYLKSRVSAFNSNNRIEEKIKFDFPNFKIVKFDSLKDMSSRIYEADIVLAHKFPAELYTNANKLKLVATPAAGKEMVKSDPNKKVKLHFGTFHGSFITESLLFSMLYFSRQMNQMILQQKNHIWNADTQSNSRMLNGSKVLIIGCGSIGLHLANTLLNLGCIVTGIRRHAESKALQLSNGKVPIKSLESVNNEITTADHIISILPSDTKTDSFFTNKHFELMKKSAYFYSMGRGNCHTDIVIKNALDNKEIAGAALDVFENEPLPKESILWDIPNLLITPHSSCVCDNYADVFYNEIKPIIENLQT